MLHHHPHDPPSDESGTGARDDSRALLAPLILIFAFLIFEIAMAVVGHSVALMADAAHMLADVVALGASLWAARLALHPPAGSWTFGLKRAEILSAQANGITLLVLAALLAFVSIGRLINPPSVQGGIVLIVAAVGIAVNVVAAALLRNHAHMSLNVEGSFRHVVTDLFAFIATLVAGALILATGFERADAIASLFVVGLMLRSAYALLKDSGRILLEGGPTDIDVRAMAHDLASQPRVTEVHDVHLWTITSGFPALSAHVLVDRTADCHALRRQLEELLSAKYDITHTTLQVDHAVSRIISRESLLAARARDRPHAPRPLRDT